MKSKQNLTKVDAVRNAASIRNIKISDTCRASDRWVHPSRLETTIIIIVYHFSVIVYSANLSQEKVETGVALAALAVTVAVYLKNNKWRSGYMLAFLLQQRVSSNREKYVVRCLHRACCEATIL